MTFLAALSFLAALATPAVGVPIGGALLHAGASLDAAAWARLPHTSATVVDHDGRTGEYEGVKMGDVLRDAGAPVGDGVRGPAASAYVVVTAKDGYAAVFALGELETTDARCAPLLTETRDGTALAAPVGPVQVIVPCDRTHARWVREVAGLTVVVARAPIVSLTVASPRRSDLR